MARLGVRGIGTAGAADGRAWCYTGDAAGERKPAVSGPVVPAALTSSDDAGVDRAAPLLHLSTSHKHLLFNGSRGPARVLVMWMCWEMRGVCSSVQRRAEDAREGLADAIWDHLSSRVHHDAHLRVPARSVRKSSFDSSSSPSSPTITSIFSWHDPRVRCQLSFLMIFVNASFLLWQVSLTPTSWNVFSQIAAGSRYRPVVGVAVFHSRGVFICSAGDFLYVTQVLGV